MKLKGIVETNFGFAEAKLCFGEYKGNDCVQISFPVLGDMNNETKNAVITATTVDCVFEINEMPTDIHIEKEDGKWQGFIDVKAIEYKYSLEITYVAEEPEFGEHTFVIPEENVRKLNEHNDFTNEACEGIMKYELNNPEVLSYVKGMGIDVENHHDFATICALMKKTSEIIHHDGVHYNHDSENIGTIAQIKHAEKQGNYTNCRGISIILAGVLRAYGFVANVVECWPAKSDDMEIHVVCEVYAEDDDKYVLLDVSNNLIYFRDGKPLSLVELREAITKGETDKLTANEDFSHNGNAVSLMELFAYMSKNVMCFRKSILSDETHEMDNENSIALVSKDLLDLDYPKSTLYTCNVQEFYTVK